MNAQAKVAIENPEKPATTAESVAKEYQGQANNSKKNANDDFFKTYNDNYNEAVAVLYKTFDNSFRIVSEYAGDIYNANANSIGKLLDVKSNDDLFEATKNTTANLINLGFGFYNAKK